MVLNEVIVDAIQNEVRAGKVVGINTEDLSDGNWLSDLTPDPDEVEFRTGSMIFPKSGEDFAPGELTEKDSDGEEHTTEEDITIEANIIMTAEPLGTGTYEMEVTVEIISASVDQ